MLLAVFFPGDGLFHADNLADAVVFLANNYNAKDIEEFVNIGTGEDLTIKGLAKLISEIVRFKGKIEYDNSKPDGTPRKLLDVSKLEDLNWRAKTSLKEGIKKTYEWFVQSYFN